MKYFNEEQMAVLRNNFESKIDGWQDVRQKKMFGFLSYLAGGKMFAFLVNDGLVITNLNQEEREAIAERYPSESFQAGGRRVGHWLKINLASQADMQDLLPAVRVSYHAALEKKN